MHPLGMIEDDGSMLPLIRSCPVAPARGALFLFGFVYCSIPFLPWRHGRSGISVHSEGAHGEEALFTRSFDAQLSSLGRVIRRSEVASEICNDYSISMARG